MTGRLSAILATTAVAVGAVVASASYADATAVTTAPVRTFHEALNFNLVGTGSLAGWYRHLNALQLVVLSPRLEYYTTFRDEGFDSNGKLVKTNEVDYIVGGSQYTRVNSGRWSVQKQSPAQLRADVYAFNTAVGLAKFKAIPGIKLVAPHHYQVTASRAHANAFLTYEYGLTSSDLADGHIAAVTIGVWTDSSGYLTKIMVTAKSAEESVYSVETFTDYNKPLTITAPRTK